MQDIRIVASYKMRVTSAGSRPVCRSGKNTNTKKSGKSRHLFKIKKVANPLFPQIPLTLTLSLRGERE